MASAPHPGSPGWAGLMEEPTAGPGLPPPGPEGDSGERRHGAWSGEWRWEDVETHMWAPQQKPGDSRAPPFARLIPQGTRSWATGARLQARSGACDTRCILSHLGRRGHFRSSVPSRAGWVQPGGAQGRADARLALFLVGWGRGESQLFWEPHVLSRQTQADPGTSPSQAWPPRARAWSKASGCCSCRRGRQPERPLQHDHAGAAGVLAGREGQLEAREAALRDRLGPHRGGEAVQVCGKHRGGAAGRGSPAWTGSHTRTRSSAGEMLGSRAKGQDGTLGTCPLP